MSLVVPAVLPSSRKDFEEKLALLSKIQSVNRIQIDVVDGKFASPTSWPYSAPAELRTMVQQKEMLPYTHHFEYEVDLMSFNAERDISVWLALGATRLTFHVESLIDAPRFLASALKLYGAGDNFASGLISFGVALNIASDPALLEVCIGKISYVQFMGISRIGRQAEPFDQRVLGKIRAFKQRHPDIPVQVDGGISLENAKRLIAIGVSNLVIGSSILCANDPASTVMAFEELQSPYGV